MPEPTGPELHVISMMRYKAAILGAAASPYRQWRSSDDPSVAFRWRRACPRQGGIQGRRDMLTDKKILLIIGGGIAA
ncbi:MAG: hypothetical protein WBA02_14845, partial [Jannaschia helgolandensis]|uniref:hypothetical protein n=1 Tax=Jannaschia helgolandensis TaxID=188906 RepID=UPI003C74C86D